MKRVFALAIVCFFVLVNAAYAANWTVTVNSKKDVYNLRGKAVFRVKVKKNGRWVRNKKIILKASFPDGDTPVTLRYIKKGRYVFRTRLRSVLEEQTFNVSIAKRKRPNRILARASKTITVITGVDNSFTIQEGDYVKSNEVTLMIDSNQNYELLISEDPLFAGASWRAYSQEITYLLSNGDGKKTIYIKFKHKITQREQIESAQITLDTISPQMTILSPLGGTSVTGRTN